jgi:hypothetical protein
MERAFLLLASVFFLPKVINFSAKRWASCALGHVVVSEQSLTVRAAARQMSVFLESACHVFSLTSILAGVAL